jgi:hypothetical protein
LGGVDQIAAPLGGTDLLEQHVTYEQLAVGPAHQIVAEFQSDDLRKVFVLCDRPNLLLVELAQPKTILEVSTTVSVGLWRSLPGKFDRE